MPDYWGGGAEIDVHPATVPDYWGAEIDWGPRSMYTLSRCLITGGGGGRDRCTPCHGAGLLGGRDRLGAEIDVHPVTVPDYWGGGGGARSMYTLPRCRITGGPRSTGGRNRCTPCHGA